MLDSNVSTSKGDSFGKHNAPNNFEKRKDIVLRHMRGQTGPQIAKAHNVSVGSIALARQTKWFRQMRSAFYTYCSRLSEDKIKEMMKHESI